MTEKYNMPDERGHFGPYGGIFVAETLIPPIQELNAAYHQYLSDPEFIAELDADLKYYVGLSITILWHRFCGYGTSTPSDPQLALH